MCAYISKVISIGGLLIGGNNPIRIQSMTNTDTLNTNATVDQCIRLIEAGCELVRITAQGVKEANNLREIRTLLHSKGYTVPLIADIHYNPKAAEVAATIVDKVRINPGNYITHAPKTSKVTSGLYNKADYSEADYLSELNNIAINLKPLITICKQYGTTIRIGVNHGSLGNRIVSRYGDTVEGMVVSALEYARICDKLNFNNLVISVKSSNTVMMLNAYRELALRLQQDNLNYPLHIGVTEAGDGEDGRMKSIAGIGAVLAHGIGDTIRVSLTEDPEKELPVATRIVERFSDINNRKHPERKIRWDLKMNSATPICSNDRKSNENVEVFVSVNGNIFSVSAEGKIHELPPDGYLSVTDKLTDIEFATFVKSIMRNPHKLIFLRLPAGDCGHFIKRLRNTGCENRVMLCSCKLEGSLQEILIENSIHPGALFLDGLGHGICIEAGKNSIREIALIGFGILQATRAKVTRTEYIACPSCGRTHFNIQQRLLEVKKATEGLPGLKIAVMGCIVNGPGEMADADYGYVGAGKGKVSLYKGKTLVNQSVPEDRAVEELLKIIDSDLKNRK